MFFKKAKLVLPITLLLSSFVSLVAPNEFDYNGWLSIKLYHCFDDKPDASCNFKERGNITISNIRSSSAMSVQPSLTQLDVDKLQVLAIQNQMYRIKAEVRTSTRKDPYVFRSSMLACNFLGSNLEDVMNLWLDAANEPVALNMVTRPGTVCTTDKPKTRMITTDVQLKYPDGGPVPDTATYIQKLEREKQAREAGEVKDNRSFFAKYWMYIVPALIFFVLTSATNPEAAGGGGGGAALRQ